MKFYVLFKCSFFYHRTTSSHLLQNQIALCSKEDSKCHVRLLCLFKRLDRNRKTNPSAKKINIFWKSAILSWLKAPFRLNFQLRSRWHSTNKQLWSNRSNIHNTNRSFNCASLLIQLAVADCSGRRKYTSGRFCRYN